MIDSIKKIGEDSIMKIGEGKEGLEPFLKSLVIGGWLERIKRRSKMEKPLLMKLIFSFDEKKARGDFIELDNSRLREYYWVRNTEGNLPQNRLTTDKLNYLINSEKNKRSI